MVHARSLRPLVKTRAFGMTHYMSKVKPNLELPRLDATDRFQRRLTRLLFGGFFYVDFRDVALFVDCVAVLVGLAGFQVHGFVADGTERLSSCRSAENTTQGRHFGIPLCERRVVALRFGGTIAAQHTPAPS
jgi:hypothetical protein